MAIGDESLVVRGVEECGELMLTTPHVAVYTEFISFCLASEWFMFPCPEAPVHVTEICETAVWRFCRTGYIRLLACRITMFCRSYAASKT